MATSRSKRYISREEKRERGIRTNIWDAARSLQEKRLKSGEERQPLRKIIKEEEFRRNWNKYSEARKVKISEIDSPEERRRAFMERVEAAEYWDWWEEDDDGNWRYVT